MEYTRKDLCYFFSLLKPFFELLSCFDLLENRSNCTEMRPILYLLRLMKDTKWYSLYLLYEEMDTNFLLFLPCLPRRGGG